MYLIDTNIFLEVLLSRSRKDDCKKFLTALYKGEKTGIITDFTIHSIIVIMRNFKLHELKTFLLSLTAYKGLIVYNAVALSTEADAILSFDKHFNNLSIPREEP
jgi:predicted nucleic acid-binding protein